MSKNIVLLADGTWNDGEGSNTNIHWLNTNLINDSTQRVFYERGVGTDWYNEKTGGALGVGLSRNIRALYADLIKVYEAGDDVYCFGFSRGAYTVRSLCGFVKLVGRIKSSDEKDIQAAYQYYRYHEPNEEDNWFEKLLKPESVGEIPIRFVGVFDTVGALGVPFEIENQADDEERSILERLRDNVVDRIDRLGDRLRKPITGFHDTTLGSNVEEAYHAVALDERRNLFAPTLWSDIAGNAFKLDSAGSRRDITQTVEQRWFAGVHSDIGGGYEIDESEKHAHIPLYWIAAHAKNSGLRFTDGFYQLKSRVEGGLFLSPLHDSMTERWKKTHKALKKSPITRPVGNVARKNSPTSTVADLLVNTKEVIDPSVSKRVGNEIRIISEATPEGIKTIYQPQNYDESLVENSSEIVGSA